MSKDIRHQLRVVSKRMRDEIKLQTDPKNYTGMAYECYQGGYLQAINDVMLALEGAQPNTRNWWNGT